MLGRRHRVPVVGILDWAHVSHSFHKAIRSARLGKAFRAVRPQPEERKEVESAQALEEATAYPGPPRHGGY